MPFSVLSIPLLDPARLAATLAHLAGSLADLIETEPPRDEAKRAAESGAAPVDASAEASADVGHNAGDDAGDDDAPSGSLAPARDAEVLAQQLGAVGRDIAGGLHAVAAALRALAETPRTPAPDPDADADRDQRH